MESHDLVAESRRRIVAGREFVDEGQQFGFDVGRPCRLHQSFEEGASPAGPPLVIAGSQSLAEESQPLAVADLAEHREERTGQELLDGGVTIWRLLGGQPADLDRRGNRPPVVVGRLVGIVDAPLDQVLELAQRQRGRFGFEAPEQLRRGGAVLVGPAEIGVARNLRQECRLLFVGRMRHEQLGHRGEVPRIDVAV